jgi:elongation factor Tu
MIAVSHVEDQSDKEHCTYVDCPGYADFGKKTITAATQMDGAILVVNAADRPISQMREHIRLARQVGVPEIVFFVDMVELPDNAELLDLVKM